MEASIPKYSLLDIVKPLLPKGENKVDYYVASFASPMCLSAFPHRATYFGVALCTKGSATLLANLDRYPLVPGTLIVMGPEIIRSWEAQSATYAEEIVFFTEAFFMGAGHYLAGLSGFEFLSNHSPKALLLTTNEQDKIHKLIKDIKQSSTTASPRQAEMVRNYIHILLNQIADIYDGQALADLVQNDSQRNMVLRFKKVLMENYLKLHTVNEYAELLNISAKHLSQTIKANTGKTAGKWIQELLILEAKVRLRQGDLSINQIADVLNFSDASLFGKYFKRYVGCSPAAYRKAQ